VLFGQSLRCVCFGYRYSCTRRVLQLSPVTASCTVQEVHLPDQTSKPELLNARRSASPPPSPFAIDADKTYCIGTVQTATTLAIVSLLSLLPARIRHSPPHEARTVSLFQATCLETRCGVCDARLCDRRPCLKAG
jgi:hypothetical protein